MVDDKLLPFVMRHLPDAVREKAAKELGETPEKRSAGIRELKELASVHEVTRGIDFAEDFLLQFLRQRKFDVSRAFDQLVNFTRLRTTRSHIFLNVDTGKFMASRRFFTPLPSRCQDGCTLVLYELGYWETDEISFDEARQFNMMLFLQCLRDPMAQINGFKVIYDFTNTSALKHGRHFTPKEIYHIYHAAVFCVPVRCKEIHMVIDSVVIMGIWTIIKKLLSQKLRKRVFIHSSTKDLLQHFPKAVLPAPFGGDLEEYYLDKWLMEANERHKGFTARGQDNLY